MKEIIKLVEEFNEKAKNGEFPECSKCPRNPSKNLTTYASTCLEHFEININGLLIILRDPGGSKGGAARTAKLCPFCNNDRSAIRFRALLNHIQVPRSHIYFCNAILHGFEAKNTKPSDFEIYCCRGL